MASDRTEYEAEVSPLLEQGDARCLDRRVDHGEFDGDVTDECDMNDLLASSRWRRGAVASGIGVVALIVVAAAASPSLQKMTGYQQALFEVAPVGYIRLRGECGGQMADAMHPNTGVEACATLCDKSIRRCTGFSVNQENVCALHNYSCSAPWSSNVTYYQKHAADSEPLNGSCVDRPLWWNGLTGGCFEYAERGMCVPEQMGPGNGYPEKACCVCGGGARIETLGGRNLFLHLGGLPLVQTGIRNAMDSLDLLDLQIFQEEKKSGRGEQVDKQQVAHMFVEVEKLAADDNQTGFDISFTDTFRDRVQLFNTRLQKLKGVAVDTPGGANAPAVQATGGSIATAVSAYPPQKEQ